MRYFAGLLALALFLVLLGFAIKNMGVVSLHYYLGFVWTAPLSLMLLLSMMVGVVLGVIACMRPITKMRKELIALKQTRSLLE
jgi:lipopolysaccharide assembly protein A